MLNTLKDLIKSKKFDVLIFSVLALVCTVLAGQMDASEAVQSAIGLVMVYLGAQGLADFGKEKSGGR